MSVTCAMPSERIVTALRKDGSAGRVRSTVSG